MKEALFFTALPHDEVRCRLCPHECRLKPGQRGLCRVRVNRGGCLVTENYGLLAAFSEDPIEKKPLYHYFPGSMILSAASFGCNLHCPWCQNWNLSQGDLQGEYFSPEQLVRLMKSKGERRIAFTYSEPLMWYEFILDFASSSLWEEDRPEIVLVTNGYINHEPLKRVMPYIKAVNLDVKAFNEKVHRAVTGGGLKPVLDNAVFLYQQGVHLELTYLIVPGFNDEREQISSFIQWVKESLSAQTPVHFSRYFPSWKWKAPPTRPEVLDEALEMARRSLHYVYGGNIDTPGVTFCPACRKAVIYRQGYAVKNYLIQDGKCPFCGERIAGCFITGAV